LRIFESNHELWLPRPLEEVFAFFSDAANLERITPPWLEFRIVSPLPIEMRPGARVDYRLKLRGLPLRWQSEITAWQPPHRFVDEQRRGPYRLWWHEHDFERRDGGTLARDRVRYSVWGGALIDRLLVRRDVAEIFAFRREALKHLFDPEGGLEPAVPRVARGPVAIRRVS